MKRNRFFDVMVMGFALFAIFFGAGNLIFPPYLGQITASSWQEAMLGFLTTDPILPILGLIAAAIIGGEAGDLGKRVSPFFAKAIAMVAMLIIGPLFAIPRTAATVHEIAVKPWFPTAPPFLTSLIFLGLTYILIFKQGRVIDIIGKYLTPILLVVLTVLIGKCIISPIGAIAAPAKDIIADRSSFFIGFSEGYQTMDALGATLMVGIVTADMLRRGYDNPKERFKLSLGVAFVAGLLLALVYGGLTYVGATASSLMPAGEFTRVELLLGVSEALLGNFGVLVLAICVSVACLTTSTGLTTMVGDFFSHELFADKIKYQVIVSLTIIISFIISIFGTEKIIAYAGPVLNIIYPVVIVLIFLTLFDKIIKHNQTYIFPTLITLVISFVNTAVVFAEDFLNITLAKTGFAFILPVNDFLLELPLAKFGFPWLVPAVLALVLGIIVGGLKKTTA